MYLCLKNVQIHVIFRQLIWIGGSTNFVLKPRHLWWIGGSTTYKKVQWCSLMLDGELDVLPLLYWRWNSQTHLDQELVYWWENISPFSFEVSFCRSWRKDRASENILGGNAFPGFNQTLGWVFQILVMLLIKHGRWQMRGAWSENYKGTIHVLGILVGTIFNLNHPSNLKNIAQRSWLPFFSRRGYPPVCIYKWNEQWEGEGILDFHFIKFGFIKPSK